MVAAMFEFLFTSFEVFAVSELLLPMIGLIIVFGFFRLGYYLFVGGFHNE